MEIKFLLSLVSDLREERSKHECHYLFLTLASKEFKSALTNYVKIENYSFVSFLVCGVGLGGKFSANKQKYLAMDMGSTVAFLLKNKLVALVFIFVHLC